MTIDMLASYYGCKNDSNAQFASLKIAKKPDYREHINRYNVICVNMQDFFSNSDTIEEMITVLKKYLLFELKREWPDCILFDEQNFSFTLKDIYAQKKVPFVILIDEWDCVFREAKQDTAAQRKYLDFLRDWLKDKEYTALVYMTGILPIKKYGSHSALNMFQEFSMTNQREMEEYVGFTESEVKELCDTYGRNFDEMKAWYDGYSFLRVKSVYNPKAVVEAVMSGIYDSYWTKTETYEALRTYIEMNYAGLKDMIIEMLAGGKKHINTGKFGNDMTNFESADDVLTLLVHLGYLAYDFEEETVAIPNREISKEFYNAVEGIGWTEIVQSVKKSKLLLQKIWEKDELAVAAGIESAHYENSILQYHDENALSYTVSLALYSARQYYNIIRELPTGKGFSDLVYVPRKMYADKPAMIVELKWDKAAETAIAQIKAKKYPQSLKEYQGNLLLVGVSYDKKSKIHTCKIEEWNKQI